MRENENGQVQLTKDLAERFHQLTLQAKEIETELSELKTTINACFDEMFGANTKGESIIGDYKVQRQIRNTETYHTEKTVQKLEELNLTECIQVIKQPDKDKVDAALKLDIIKQSDLKDCIHKRVSKVILVKEL